MPDRKKILVLDDDPEILELMVHILGNRYQLLTKLNTDNLEKDIQEFQPHVILIDHFLGETTSNDVLKRWMDGVKHIPVILHSAHEDIEKISAQANVAGYIRKPSSIHEIRESVAKVVDNN